MSSPPTRSVLLRLAVALACAVLPGVLHAQDTLKIPTATTAPRVSQPSAADADAGQDLVTVPNLAGRSVDEARRVLAGAGLFVGRVAEGQGEGTPGSILQQQPRAGSVVARRSDVRLWIVPRGQHAPPVTYRPPVTQEPARVTVPRLIGRTTGDARAALAAVGLEVGAVAEVAGAGTPGTVVRQLPAAGSPVEPRSTVRLWVVPARVAADPPRDSLVRVPNLAGRTPAQARAVLASAGLRLAGVAEGSGTGAPGTIARQQPAAGAAVAPGSGVRLWTVPLQVAVGPGPSVDPSAPDAQNPPVQDPVQTPPAADSAGTPAAPRTPDSLAVPDVRRMTLREARAELELLGLAVALDAGMADSAAWTVRAQQPGPGARLATGGVVALLLDPPASGAVAGTVAPGGGVRPADAQPVIAAPWYMRRPVWIALAVVLLLAVIAGVRALRRPRALPVGAVRARLRMDAPARVAVEGAPFAAGGLRYRMNPGRAAARVSTAGPIFVNKEVSGDE